MNKFQGKPIQSVQRAVDILNCFGKEHQALTLHQISQTLELNINTTRGLVNTLLTNSLLSYKPESKTYGLGAFFLSKIQTIQANMTSYLEIAKPYLAEVVKKYNVPGSIVKVYENGLYPEYVLNPENSIFRLVNIEYKLLPLHATSSGLLFLSEKVKTAGHSYLDHLTLTPYTPKTLTDKAALLEQLARIQSQGYSVEREEWEPYIGGAAVPIYSFAGDLISTVSITCAIGLLEEIIEDISRDLRQCADKINAAIRTNNV